MQVPIEKLERQRPRVFAGCATETVPGAGDDLQVLLDSGCASRLSQAPSLRHRHQRVGRTVQGQDGRVLGQVSALTLTAAIPGARRRWGHDA